MDKWALAGRCRGVTTIAAMPGARPRPAMPAWPSDPGVDRDLADEAAEAAVDSPSLQIGKCGPYEFAPRSAHLVKTLLKVDFFTLQAGEPFQLISGFLSPQ